MKPVAGEAVLGAASPLAVDRQADRLRKRILTAFAVSLCCFLGVGVAVSSAMRAFESTDSEILAIHGRSLALLLRLRRRREEMSRVAASFVASRAPPDAAARVGSLQREISDESERLDKLFGDPEQLARWRAGAKARADFSISLLAAIHLAAAGDAPGAKRSLAAADDAAAQVDRDTESLTTADARRVRTLADLLDQRLSWALWLNLVAVVLGALAATGLLRAGLSALRDYSRAMQRRLEDLDLFAGRIAHDIRQPLNALSLVLGSAEQAAGDDRVRRGLSLGRQTIHRLDEMTEDMLAFSRSAFETARPAPIALRPLAEEVLGELQGRPAFEAIEWHFSCVGETLEVAMSPGNLRSVLWNLLDNAAKYLSPDGLRWIALHLEPGRQGCRIRISDSGPGIPRDQLRHVFEPFKRATSAGTGHGLGLATVKRLVEAHGGTIGVESRPGHGAVFTVELPAR